MNITNITNGTWPGNITNGTWPGNITNGTWPGNITNGTWPGNITNGTWPGNITNGTLPETLSPSPSASSVPSSSSSFPSPSFPSPSFPSPSFPSPSFPSPSSSFPSASSVPSPSSGFPPPSFPSPSSSRTIPGESMIVDNGTLVPLIMAVLFVLVIIVATAFRSKLDKICSSYNLSKYHMVNIDGTSSEDLDGLEDLEIELAGSSKNTE